MSIAELWSLQGSTKNELLIGHLRKSNIISTNLQVELDCLQLQAGVSWEVLSREGTMIQKYVGKCWTSHLWEFNNRYGLMVKQENKAWLLPLCEHDQFIMEALTNHPAATSKRLQGAQCCHLFLQVMTLADITNSAGAKLSEWVTNPRYSQLSQWWSYPQLSQPSQTKLHSMEWLHQASPASFYIWYKQQANGNWYQGQISQACNQVFSPADHKIYSFETEPRHMVQVYERQYTHWSCWWHYQRSSATLTFPINAVPR